jgi:flagellar motor switch protein FliN/FliY
MSDDASKKVDQNEIEALLNQAKSSAKPAAAAPPAASDAGDVVSQSEIEALLSDKASASGPPARKAAAEDDTAGRILGQNDIEALLNKASQKPPAGAPTPVVDAASGRNFGEGEMAQGDIELLLSQAEQALASIDNPHEMPAGIKPLSLEDFAGAPPSNEVATLELIRDVELDLRIEFGRTHMYIEDVLKLRKGSVVSLDKLAGDPVDIFVNDRLIARGEVLVLNDNFCVRVAELIAGESVAAG